MRFVNGIVADHFVIGRIISTVPGISCSAPMSDVRSGAAPPMTSIGLAFWYAVATAVTTSVTPGPAVTTATPHLRVRRL